MQTTLIRQKSWLLTCLICGKTGGNLVAMQEHAMHDHGYEEQDHRHATRRGERAIGYVWTMPDGADWMRADWISEED